MSRVYRTHDAPRPLQSAGYPAGTDGGELYPGGRFLTNGVSGQRGDDARYAQFANDDADPIITLNGAPEDYELRAISDDAVGVFPASAAAPETIGTQDATRRNAHIAALRQLDAANRAFWRRR